MPHLKALVYGVPRSGQHFLAALLHANYCKIGDYTAHCGGHAYKKVKISPNTQYVYIWRKLSDVAASLFKIRERFGLSSATDISAFSRSSLCELFKPAECCVLCNGVKVTRVDHLFESCRLTFCEYYWQHLEAWKSIADKHPNVSTVSYEWITENQLAFLSIFKRGALGVTICPDDHKGWKSC